MITCSNKNIALALMLKGYRVVPSESDSLCKWSGVHLRSAVTPTSTCYTLLFLWNQDLKTWVV